MTPPDHELQALACIGKALADPTRCRLLLALLPGPGYPAELASGLGLSKAAVSNHLAYARSCGLVTGTAEGRRVRYELAHPGLTHALNDLLAVAASLDAGCDADPGAAAARGAARSA